MTNRFVLALAGLVAAGASSAFAQSTGTPSFRAPTPSFIRNELSGVVSFPEVGGTGFEAVYRRSNDVRIDDNGAVNSQASRLGHDYGARIGIMDPGSGLPTSFIVGLEGRAGFYSRTPDFPLDASLVLGVGGQFREGSSVFLIPAGLSVGRRIDIRDSDISFVPYAQPTFSLRTGNNNIGTDLLFTLGLGADVRVNQSLDLRLGVGLGDMDGISLGAAWIR